MDKPISKPHDHFFRDLWSDRDLALDFLQNYLPASILAMADLDSLEIQKDSFQPPFRRGNPGASAVAGRLDVDAARF
jgi:hypothetical protein